METLTIGQFNTVYNFLSLVIASMGAAFVFLMGARSKVAPQYRSALLVSSVVVAVAAYHYWRIFQSWEAAYVLQDGVYAVTGVPFNDAYRYADWLLTVPLLMVEVVAVLGLTRAKSRSLFAKLTIAATLMIATGYPGEIATDNTTRLIWGTISTIPFLYILYVLWGELSKATADEPEDVQILMRNTKLVLLATWGVYPIAYLFPVFGISGAGALIGLQVGYSIADITAKAGFGLMIYAIARAKTRHDVEAGRIEGEEANKLRLAS